MSAETFTTAMFLITAVIAAGVLVNAVFPVVYNMAGTFSSATHESDERLRTDFKIVTYTATSGNPGTANIWIKNIGSSRIPMSDFTNRSDVFCGGVGNFKRLVWTSTGTETDSWTNLNYDVNNNDSWDPGETIQVTARTLIPSNNAVYFQFILPSGVYRSIEFNPAS
jgi:archaeal flagellar protein FlaG